MRSRLRTACFLPCLAVVFLSCFAATAPAQTPAQLASAEAGVAHANPDKRLAALQFPLAFEPNLGQDPAAVRFTASGAGYRLELEQRSAVLDLSPGKAANEPRARIELELLNSNAQAALTGAETMPGVSNYVPASDPATWTMGVRRYNRVDYDQVYPGTGLAFYAHQHSIEYDFRLQPGADTGRIKLAIRGAESARIDSDGSLVLTTSGKEMRFLAPVAYQPGAAGKRDSVAAHYTLAAMQAPSSGSRESAWMLAFEVAPHDAARELVIDPVLSYGAILPGIDYNVGPVANDTAGNLYVSGYNQQRGFYIAKFDVNGANVFTTVVGSGAASAFPVGMVLDSTGKIYVTGYSNAGLPATANAYLNYTGTHTVTFLAVFPSTGAAPTYLSYIGGTKNYDYASGLAVDSTGKVYVTGDAVSSDFPTTSGSYQSTNPLPGQDVAFVAKFNPAASGAASLVYSTFIGTPNSTSYASSIAVDSAGDAYVGIASNIGFPISTGAFQYRGQLASGGFSNGAYVAKLNPAGSDLLYSAFLGPGIPTSIQVDGSNDAYVTGSVQVEDFPTTAGAYQTSYPAGFVSELNPGGSALIYSTFLGGPSGGNSPEAGNTVFPQAIAIAPGCTSACAAYITGYTSETDFPMIAPLQSAIGGSPAPFITELAGNGASATFSTFLGGLTASLQLPSTNPIPLSPSISVDGSGNIYFAADVSGTQDFPVTVALPTPQGSSYIAKISPTAGAILAANPVTVNFDSYGVVEIVGVPSTTNPNPAYYAAANPVPVILRNLGSTAVTISSIAFSPAGEFSETDQCNLVIPAGGTCTLNLIFTPAAAGKRAATLTVTSNAAHSPLTIPVSGTASASGYLISSATSVTFADQVLGTTSAQQMFTITNIGKTLVNLSPILPTPGTISSQYGSGTDFQVLNNCPLQIADGASCTVGVTFDPIAGGLREASVQVQGDGQGNPLISLYGTGVAGNYGSLVLSATALNFNTQLINTQTTQQYITLTNTSNQPITLYSVAIATKNQTSGSDFALTGGNCTSTPPVVVKPQATCSMTVRFTPSTAAAESGTITITDSAAGSPHAVALTGIGLAAAQALEFSPPNYVFPDQPVGITTTPQTIYVFNVSTAPVLVDRVLVTGDFQITGSTCPGSSLRTGPASGVTYNFGSSCTVRITFTPTAIGTRTGTLSFVDSAGATQVLNLAGSGIVATGGVIVEPSSLIFPAQAIGTTSITTQHINIFNPGNSATTINSITATGDYAIVNLCNTPPFTLNLLANCGVDISFTPVGTANPHPGSLVVSSSGGNATTTISGTGVTASLGVGVTPTALNFGNVQVGVASFTYNIYFRNTGTDPVTLTSATVPTGDFGFNTGSCGFSGNVLAPATSCYIQANLTPSTTGARSANITLVDSAGTQTIAMTGVGTAAVPTYLFSPGGVSFNQQTVGTTSTVQTIYFDNNLTTPLVMSTAAITTGGTAFVIVPGGDRCTGITIAAGSYCTVTLQFSPATAGYQVGSLTLTDSKAAKYVVPLAGYSPAVAVSAYVDPTGLNFPSTVLTTTSNAENFSLFNSGNTPLTVGTLTGTGTIIGASTTGVFSANGAQGGNDSCTGAIVQPGSRCSVTVTYTPLAAVASTGTITVPVTYSNNTTASFVVSLAGTGQAVKDSAELTPAALNFADQALNAVYAAGADAPQVFNLYNPGNLPFTVGTLTSTDVVVNATKTGDFSTAPLVGGSDGCTGIQVSPRTSCQVYVAFTPISVGAKSGSIVFPVTYADNTKTTVTATVTGKGVAANSTLVVTPTVAQFDSQVVGTTSTSDITITVTNTGNQPIKIATSTLTSSFSFAGDYCSGTTLGINTTCTITVAFSPTTTGAIAGTLTIPDSAAGNPHKVSLTGTGLATSAQIVLSQTSINFGQQLVGTRSNSVNVFVTNQSSSTVPISNVVLGGTNAADFLMTNSCAGSSIGASQYCIISVAFNPAAASTGTRSAAVTETDSATGSPRTIVLSGIGVAAAPSVAFYPTSLNFGSQALGVKSAPMTFSITNTGNANLVIGTLTSSNASEFAISSNTCAGKTIAAGANCLVNVTFDPNAGSTQTATISIADNITGSPQTVTVTGVSVGLPKAALTPASLTFATTGVGVASASEALTLANAGTDVLKIASIAITGANATDFTQTNTCGTSVASSGSCTITVTFKPTAVGTRAASVVVTDNAGNVAGTTQTSTLAGTGTGVPTVSISPTAANYPSTFVGSSSATGNFTVKNTGTAPLSITSIVMGGTYPGDYSETNTCGASVAVGGSCVVSVIFKPTAPGARAAAIVITDNAANSPQSIPISGTGVGVAKATISSTGLTFASTGVGVTSAAQTFTITNSGSATLAVTALALSGTNASDFHATSTTCPGSIAVNGSCTVSVTFTPAAAGARSATLTITDNSGGTAGATQTVPLAGTGAGVPMVAISPTSFTFAAAAVGNDEGPLSVIVKNAGTAALTISSIKITGADPADFLEFDTCAPSVAADTSCEIALYFEPKAIGTRTASVVITDNANNVANSTQTIPITGTGTGAPKIAFTAGTLTFAAQKVGTLSAGKSITVSNSGNAPLTFASVALNGADPGDYMQFNSCTTLAPGDTCVLVVFFDPAATGTRTAGVVFTDNTAGVANSTQTVQLSGTGN